LRSKKVSPRTCLALVLQRYAEGELSADQFGQVLGQTFHETEQFLRDYGAPGLGPQEHSPGLRNLERLDSG
jgi:hypothetical protein